MHAPLLVKGRGYQEGYTPIASPETAPLRWLSLGRLGLAMGHAYKDNTGEQEAVLDVLAGTVTLEIDGPRQEHLGGRSDPFGAGPTLICLPPSTAYRVTSLGHTADVLIVRAPVADVPETAVRSTVVRPEDAPGRRIGAANWARQVWPGTALAPGTQRLMVGETLNPPGNWSSYPPHKHDTENPPIEAIYEEVYFFSIKPVGGFGIQRVYECRQAEDALDEVFVVEDGDVAIIPRGYHPVVAAPGYQLAYVWALCGTGRTYGAWSNDPAHDWVRNVEPLLETR